MTRPCTHGHNFLFAPKSCRNFAHSYDTDISKGSSSNLGLLATECLKTSREVLSVTSINVVVVVVVDVVLNAILKKDCPPPPVGTEPGSAVCKVVVLPQSCATAFSFLY